MLELREMLAGIASDDAAGSESQDRATQRILDSALAEAGISGLRRMTVDDVVRRAGISRMTLYRRWPRREDLIQALISRESQRFLLAVAAGHERAPNRAEGLTESFVAAVEFARRHPLFQLAQREPGVLVEAVAADEARMLEMGRAFIARYVHGDHPGKASRDAQWVADVWARLFLTYVLVPPSDPDIGDDRQLRRFAADVLRPMVARLPEGKRPR
jgi:TetR/AcrR family transcriptional repressor of uid operon